MRARYVAWAAGAAAALSVGAGAWLLTSRLLPEEPKPPVRNADVRPPVEIERNTIREPEAKVGSCHDEELTAPNIPIQRVEGEPVQTHGGKLRDGTYDVATYHVFGKPPERALPATFRQTIVVEQNGTIAKHVRIGRRGQAETTTWSATVRGSDLQLTGVCPPAVKGSTETVSFDTQGENLVMSFEQAGVPVQVTYRRRTS